MPKLVLQHRLQPKIKSTLIIKVAFKKNYSFYKMKTIQERILYIDSNVSKTLLHSHFDISIKIYTHQKFYLEISI